MIIKVKTLVFYENFMSMETSFNEFMLTYPCYLAPLTPNFYIVKQGYAQVYIIFHIVS